MQPDWLSNNLILITGKGGVGKTAFSQAAARHLASKGRRTLLVHVLQVNEADEQKIEKTAPNLWQITLSAADCFKEYIILKLRLKALYTAFLGNKVTQYLERAAPGIREIVLMGKVWHERANYDHVVVDMPSTGYALAMLHTPFNFAALFPGGPVYRDSKDMIETFSNPNKTSLVIVSLAEEMPMQESIELATELKRLMPQNPAKLIVNRVVRVDVESRALFKKYCSKEEIAKNKYNQQNSPLWLSLGHRLAREKKQGELIKSLPDSWAPFSGNWIEIDEVATKSDLDRSTAIAALLKGSKQ